MGGEASLPGSPPWRAVVCSCKAGLLSTLFPSSSNDLDYAFLNSSIFFLRKWCLVYFGLPRDFLFLLCLHKPLSCSWELSRTAGMTWLWGMWSCCFSRSGRGERIFSWKLSIRFANKEISNMRIFSIMLQVSFFLFKHKKFWLFYFFMNAVPKTNGPFWVEIMVFTIWGEKRRIGDSKWDSAIGLVKVINNKRFQGHVRNQ